MPEKSDFLTYEENRLIECNNTDMLQKGADVRVLYLVSELLIPCLIFYIVAYGLMAKRNIYSDFVDGAGDGLKTAVKILPTLVGLMVTVGVLRASGFLDWIAGWIGKLSDPLGFPAALVPLAIVRLFSASAASGLLTDLYKQYGTDSQIGTIASLMMSCTETVFYTMSVYFLAARVNKTRYTLAGALAAVIAGIAASVVLAGFAG